MDGVAWMDRSASAEAFEHVVALHYVGLVRRLTVVLGGDHEAGRDLAQETCARALRAWERFDGADARAWLHTIGLRLAFNERDRRRRWGRSLGSRDVQPAWVTPRDRGLHEALAALRREHRAALLLTVVDGYTQAEVAAMLDVAPGTVASWLSRAKAQLRKAMSDV